MTELKTLGFLGTFLLCALYATTSRGAEVHTDLGLQVAKVAVNEGAFKYRVTVALVWQVVRENGGKTIESMSEFLSRHSPRVNGRKPCKVGNCFWTPNLDRSDAQPLGLDFPNDVKRNYWPKKVLRYWKDTLAYSDWLVRGMRKDHDPCQVKPTTWGGPMDRTRAIREGMFPITCQLLDGCKGDMCNDGYTTYRHCWKNGVWACEADLQPQMQSVPPVVAQKLVLRVPSLVASR